MSLFIYRTLTILLSPVIDLYILIRLKKGKEDSKRIKERYGYASIKRPEGRVTWFHAASVGETNSIVKLVKMLAKNNAKKSSFLVTVGTMTGMAMAKKKFEETNVMLQYAPIDKFFVIRRFVKYWKPDLVFLTESEIWPNMVTISKKFGGRLIIINGKMSEKSLDKWLKKPVLKRQVFRCFYLCFPQTEVEAERFRKLDIRKTKYLGNLKFDVKMPKANLVEVKKLKTQIGKRANWLVASTHEDEEEIVAKAHLELKKNHKDLLTIIVLRHPKRSVEVAKMLKKDFGLNVAVRSKNEKITSKTDVYLCDILGEMSTLYSVANIVMMGGAFIDGIGGHTPVEPAQLNCAILTPPFMFNNRVLFEELEKRDACKILKTAEVSEIVEKVGALLNNPAEVKLMQQNAMDTYKEFDGVTKRIAEEIEGNFYL
jgi:3-deoxy-D-manno-octulosonic-acid transferase